MNDKLAKTPSDAAHAQRLLNDEILMGVFDTLRTTYLDAMLYTMPEESQKRERLWQAVHVVGKVKDHLKLLLDGGKLAQAELDNVAFLQTRK